ncbi:hypothetical protein [Agrobacterium rosae]|uniref:Group II intron-encoded protein LtrA n=1 Tax=Agrobacterium rosae TaxID=1972867 RepID=A0AAW9FIB5_9HYPH|nr:hypothetical protein [Agrobacterium rosae]MDX8305421.1 hypothetical protein [Agrobacterium rosae]
MTVAKYEERLEQNLHDLCDRVHTGRYRPQAVRRVYIPKADGGKRPLGVPTLDKIVQGAVAEVPGAVYEADFAGSPMASGQGATRTWHWMHCIQRP